MMQSNTKMKRNHEIIVKIKSVFQFDIEIDFFFGGIASLFIVSAPKVYRPHNLDNFDIFFLK